MQLIPRFIYLSNNKNRVKKGTQRKEENIYMKQTLIVSCLIVFYLVSLFLLLLLSSSFQRAHNLNTKSNAKLIKNEINFIINYYLEINHNIRLIFL
jgi:hypothetical protein